MSTKAAPQTECDAMIARLLAARDEAAMRGLIAQHPLAEWDSVVSTLTDQARQEISVNIGNAQRIAEIAMIVADAIDSKVALARSQRAKANTLYAMDQHAAAIEMHRSAAALFDQVGEKNELARTLSGSIQPYLLLGRYDEALAAAERARKIFSEQGNEWRLARLEINIGNIYQRQDRFADALQHYQRAYDDLVTRDDAEGLAAVLSNLALCCIFLNDFPRALEFHQKAREYCEKKGMPILVAYADYNIAYLYFLRGEYGRAIKMLREAASSARNARDAYQLALCDLDLSEIYIEVNLSAEAVELAHKAHDGFQRLGFGYEGAKALAFAAIAASRLGQAFEGLKLFTEAKEMFVRDNNLVWPSLIDLYKSLVLLNEGRLFEARQLCTSAHEFFAKSTLKRKAVLAELLLARISFRMNDRNAARERCRAALEKSAALESPILTYDAEFLLAEIERSTGNQDAAYQAYSRARASLETLRGSLRGEELKIAFFNNKLEVYEQLVDLCLRRPNSLEEAFGYMEQAKSRSLMELLSQPVHTASDADAGQSELVRSIRNLREELNWYYNLIEREQLRPEENSPARIENLEQQAKARETELLRSLQEATDLEINQAGLQRAPASVSIEEIRTALPDETILVEYFCVQDRVLACVLSRDGLQVFPVTLQSRVQKMLQLLQFQLSKFRLDPQYVNMFQDSLLESTQAHLKNLYQELLAPLQNSLNARHLVFVPHGLLHYVPMHALHDGENYVIDKFSISYAPSASIYAMCQSQPGNSSSESLIMGIADAQAPSILDEVAALKNILPNARLFIGENATQAALEEHGPKSRIVHIATHGYFRQDNPMFSSIRLGDSYLSLYDLYHLKLPAELVVLSGCATGLNVVKPGDEQIGLVRGLLQAGAQSMILSLWDVHDASTKEFMIAFYSGLQTGGSKAVSLRNAMLKLREKCPHPYYWAPFLLIGKG
ncbi:MAG TPA: CHAT domain-containing tetratricopeptide repeat protein [Terriglobales bacterium]|nr:CHAT domain-containing tetratricopeptide repeat protein [Terriglobales bacterium]